MVAQFRSKLRGRESVARSGIHPPTKSWVMVPGCSVTPEDSARAACYWVRAGVSSQIEDNPMRFLLQVSVCCLLAGSVAMAQRGGGYGGGGARGGGVGGGGVMRGGTGSGVSGGGFRGGVMGGGTGFRAGAGFGGGFRDGAFGKFTGDS